MDPITALMAAQLIIGVGKAVLGHQAQNKAAKANESAADLAALESQRAINARLIEERIASGQDILAGERQAVSAASLARLSAVAAGVGGNSVQLQQQEIAGDLGRFKDSVDQNLSLVELQLERQRGGVEAERISRINGVPGANPYLTAFTIAGEGLDFYTKRQSYKPPKL